MFQKSAARTLKQAGDLVASGWSNDAPAVYDADGNVVARCAATALASVPRGNPRAVSFLEGTMGKGFPVVNKQPGMTQEKVVGFFRQAEKNARKAGA